jgi:hypothetical protein
MPLWRIAAGRVGSAVRPLASRRRCDNDRIANGIASLTIGHGQRVVGEVKRAIEPAVPLVRLAAIDLPVQSGRRAAV